MTGPVFDVEPAHLCDRCAKSAATTTYGSERVCEPCAFEARDEVDRAADAVIQQGRRWDGIGLDKALILAGLVAVLVLSKLLERALS